MTKDDIVQRLIDEKHITAKEAVVLLKDSEIIWAPHYPEPQPWHDYNKWVTTYGNGTAPITDPSLLKG